MAVTPYKKPLLDKLGIQRDYRIEIINPPDSYLALLGELPSGVHLLEQGSELDMIQIFATERSQLATDFSNAKKRLKPEGMLWVSWPNQSSPLAGDLRDSNVREVGLAHGLVDVKVVAIDDDWSAVKFVLRR